MSRPSGETVRKRWRFPSRWGEEKRILADVRVLARRCGFSSERIEDMVSAVAEACLNAVEHGNGLDPERWVRAEWRSAGGAVRFRVYDEGAGMAAAPDDSAAGRALFGGGEGAVAPAERERSGAESARGWGILLMRGLADEVRFFHGERGFCTELRFYLKDGDGRDE